MRVSLFLLFIIALTCGLPAIAEAQNPVTYDWRAFGATMANPKVRPDAAFAKKVAARVADEMARIGVPVNNTHGGRIRATATTGSADPGTCGYLTEALQLAFAGAGFEPAQIYGIQCVAKGTAAAGSGTRVGTAVARIGWVNVDHMAPALVIGKSVMVFDLWSHARKAGSYGGYGQSRWNGGGIENWTSAVRDYPWFKFGPYLGVPPPTQGNVGPGQIGKDIADHYYRTKYPQKERPKPKAKPVPPKIQPKSGAWVLEKTALAPDFRETGRDPRRYFHVKSTGAHGSVRMTSEWSDPDGSVRQCTASATWTIQGSHERLEPGQKMTIGGSVACGGVVMRSGIYIPTDSVSFSIHWHPPGYPAHVSTGGVGGDIIAKNFGKEGGSFENVVVTAPAKGKPGDRIALRFLVSARGYGALEYVYLWTDPKP